MPISELLEGRSPSDVQTHVPFASQHDGAQPPIDVVVPSSPARAETREVAQMSRRSEAAPVAANRTVVFDASRRSAARTSWEGGPERMGCLVPIDPNEYMRDGVWEWLMDYKPITYGQYDQLRKQGLPRPRKRD